MVPAPPAPPPSDGGAPAPEEPVPVPIVVAAPAPAEASGDSAPASNGASAPAPVADASSTPVPASNGQSSVAAPEPAAPPPPPPTPPPSPPDPAVVLAHLPEAQPDLAYIIVNEAGASVYSASPVAREEFPQFDATLRGTISIGRRLQDPLSELVKIDPQHVGVGLYQHDVNPKQLKESLEGVIESCVNTVGVDLNTASVPLLRYVSGLNSLAAHNVVEYRKNNGPFRNREQLMQVSDIGEKRFVQAAGFLKIQSGENPLDSTWIHPESYGAARQVLADLGYGPEALTQKEQLDELRNKLKTISPEDVANRLQVGVPTIRDIIDSLARPGRDPRDDLPPPIFKKGVLKLEDLQPGMELKGSVLNVVDFGAFVDIGLKDSGLVHISQMANRYVKSPYDVVTVGDVVTVWVLKVETDRRRVSLTMIAPGTERRPPERRPREQQGGGGQRREGGPPRGQRREGGPPPGQAREGGGPPPGQRREGGGAPPPHGQRREGGGPPRGQRREGGPPPGQRREGGPPPGQAGRRCRRAARRPWECRKGRRVEGTASTASTVNRVRRATRVSKPAARLPSRLPLNRKRSRQPRPRRSSRPRPLRLSSSNANRSASSRPSRTCPSRPWPGPPPWPPSASWPPSGRRARRRKRKGLPLHPRRNRSNRRRPREWGPCWSSGFRASEVSQVSLCGTP